MHYEIIFKKYVTSVKLLLSLNIKGGCIKCIFSFWSDAD
jgi:hypothetical protein